MRTQPSCAAVTGSSDPLWPMLRAAPPAAQHPTAARGACPSTVTATSWAFRRSVEAVGDAAAPTIDDARRAGRALTDAGAREVMVFGSVAKGEARPYSDIDLVVVLGVSC